MFVLRLSFTILLVALAPAAAMARDIGGTLLDAVSKQPIQGAQLRATAPGVDFSTTTDAAGAFVLTVPDPPPTSLRVRVTADGFQPLDLNLTDLDHTLELSLQAQPLFTAEVEVTGLRAEARDA